MAELPHSQSGLNPSFNLSKVMEEVNQPIPQAAGMRPLGNEAMIAANIVYGTLLYDSKTGLYTQRAFEARLDEAIQNLMPQDTLKVMVADIDNFKQVNDMLGHKAGDELLGIVAKALQTTFQRSTDVLAHGSRDYIDTIARLGGDEFAVFTVDHGESMTLERRAHNGEDETLVQTERVNTELQKLIANTRYGQFSDLISLIRVSMGLTMHQPGESAEVTLARADLAALKSKYSNKIESVNEEDKKWLQQVVPKLQDLGIRIEDWVYQAIGQEPA